MKIPPTAPTQVYCGQNRNLLILGSITLLVLGGLGFFLANRSGSNFNSEQKITREIINNNYFQDIIRQGLTTQKDLETMAMIRPFGKSFIGISRDDFTWDEARSIARQSGAEVLSITPSADGSRQQLVDWLKVTFATQLKNAAWVEDEGPQILDGTDVIPVSAKDHKRRVLARWSISSKSLQENIAPASPAAIKNWQDARFGMFIHWGPVSLKGTEIGWSRGSQVPIEEYDNLYKQFNPTKFNADEWVAVAKAAGMKYMVLTTKHHDGFCLWDTKQTDYNIMNTPFKRDAVKELAAACKKGGIAFGTYYSTCDWHHPAFPLGSPGGKSRKPNPDMKVYDAYLQAQVTELVKNYGPLFTMWFDVPQSYDGTFGIPMVNMLRKLQPDLMINNRAYSKNGVGSGIGHQLPVADYDTPEQMIGGFNMERPWETCMTICRQWAWKPNDKMKSLKECIQTLIRTNGGDGNLLFNVGPQPDGLIEPRQVERLKEMGAWLARNSPAVYETRGGPWKPSTHMVSTRKGDKIYLHLLKKADGPVSVPALPVAIKSAKLLNGPAIKTSTADGSLSFEIPADSWDEIDTIVELSIEGEAMDIAPLKPATRSNIPGAKSSASVTYQNNPRYGAGMVLDGDPETRWATPEGTKQSWLQIDFSGETTFSGIQIEEAQAGHSSRVKKFELQKKDGGTWTTFHKGDALGAHFKTSFEPITSSSIRLNILDASEGPTISEILLLTGSN